MIYDNLVLKTNVVLLHGYHSKEFASFTVIEIESTSFINEIECQPLIKKRVRLTKVL